MAKKKYDKDKIILWSVLGLLIAALVYQQVVLIINQNKIEDVSNSVSDLSSNLNKKITDVAEENQRSISDVATSLKKLDSSFTDFRSSSDVKLGELQKELGVVKSTSGDFSSLIEDIIKSVVSVDASGSLGSGAFIENNGFIVTNYHVVEKASSFSVLTYDGKTHNAVLIGYSQPYDVALLKINEGYPVLEYGDSDDVKVGEKVIAVGNPLGLSFSVTEGIISGTNRGKEDFPGTYLQTDVSINPGNSGGPLINNEGELIGINNFKISGELIEGLGFALISDDAKKVTDGLLTKYNEQV